MRRKITKEVFIERAKAIHGDKYGYDNVEYGVGEFNISIYCKFHKEYFTQSIYDHLAGKGCYKCGRLRIAQSRTKWTKELTIEESKRYKSRTEFEKKKGSAYQAALRNNWLDEMTWLKTQADYYRDGNFVYAYVDTDNKVAYVGRTMKPKERDINHRNGKRYSSVYDYWNSINKEIPQPIYLESDLSSTQSQEREHYWLIYYRDTLGYTMLNKAKTGINCGALGAFDMRWTKNKVIEESRKYSTFQEFTKNENLYSATRRKKWVDEIIAINNWKKIYNSHTLEQCMNVALKCKKLKEFRLKYKAEYIYSLKHGWLKDIKNICKY